MRARQEPEVDTWDFPRGLASVAVMTRFAGEHGVDATSILADTGLSDADLDSADRQIEARTELLVVRNLLRELGARPALGIEVGRSYRISSFGIYGYAWITSPTLGEAISLALRYFQLSFAFCTPVVEVHDQQMIARIRHDRIPDDVRQFLVERDTFAMHRVLGDLLGRPVDIHHARFAFAEPDHGDRIAAILGVHPRYGQPETSISITAETMNQPLPQANQATLTLCLAQCRELIDRRSTRTGIAADVRDHLLAGSATAGIAVPRSLDAVAHDLGITGRTLRRRLAADGTSYRVLLDEARRGLAEDMLAATALSVEEIAARLGYTEAGPFIRAFKRWTATTPAAYRRTRR
ncbi:AraC family transcriptional regulator [Nocardia mangyaensis]|uniref:AraC family transcriptional regulator n=1 Tax=Nocardia mangyaensis TaxID=2213200 RepID=UPI0026744AC9|nr:AraC family transcriptional regulator [Nocardia mangyaensis]MDO3646844.1 AraC family transcriptional regulator [Nocardia mangyaensis]